MRATGRCSARTPATARTPARLPPDLRPGLSPGTRLGPYVVISALGAGGMGEVYRGRDTRLDRTVAIKVLAPDLVGSPEARQRFNREAKAAAALAHPRICRLLDVGREGTIDYLVMEYLEGETLAARLLRGRLPRSEALTVGTQIADALATAHRVGIVHRDLKPGNIMLTPAGAMLLDFGLARQAAPLALDGPTASVEGPITRTGVILGTVQYMAPEQLEGRPVDARTDIFALGVVLYEMLTGRRAFEGSSHASVIGNILHADPPSLESIEATSPPALDLLVRKCLAKDPAGRWQTATDVHARLETLEDLLHDRTGAARLPKPSIARRPFRRSVWVASALCLAIAGGLVVWRLGGRSRPQAAEGLSQARTVDHPLSRLTFDSGLQTDPAISPDGRYVAYASDKNGNFDIYVQPMAGGDPVQVTKSPAHDTQPAWSPDGNTIVFRSERDGGGLYLVPMTGGTERLVANHGVYPSWSPDGREVRFQAERFTSSDARMFSIPLSGDPAHEVLPEFTDSGSWSWIGSRSDGGISFLGTHKKLGNGLFTVAADGRVIKTVTTGEPFDTSFRVLRPRFRWSNAGDMLCLESGQGIFQTLWLLRVEPGTLRIVSTERLATGSFNALAPGLSPDGTRVVFSGQQSGLRTWRFPVDSARGRLGGGTPVTEDGELQRSQVVPGGRWLHYWRLRPGERGEGRFWRADLQSGRTEPYSGPGGLGGAWTRDGREVAYHELRSERPAGSTADVINWRLAAQTLDGVVRAVTPWAPRVVLEYDWVVDHEVVLATRQIDDGGDIVAWRIASAPSESPSRVVFSIPGASLFQGRISPDRRWLAFVALLNHSTRAVIGITAMEGAPHREWHEEKRGS